MLPTLHSFNSSWFDDMDHVFETHFHKLINDFFQPQSIGELKNKFTNNAGYPKLDVYTSNDIYCIEAAVPGVNPADLTIEILTEDKIKYVKISGKMTQETARDDAAFRTRELRRSKFTRAVALPDNLEGDPEAEIKNGIITLTWKLPKAIPKEPAVKLITLKQT